jgi:hypothetical protein
MKLQKFISELRLRLLDGAYRLRSLLIEEFNHLALDANLSAFYSLPIFDTLAPLAIPVAIEKRTFCAATNRPFYPIQSIESFGPAFNPVPPDGGQHTT